MAKGGMFYPDLFDGVAENEIDRVAGKEVVASLEWESFLARV